MFGGCVFIFCLLAVLPPRGIHCGDMNVTDVAERTENALAKLVKMFSKPGAFKQIDAILGENTIEASYTSCPMGEEGLECRRAEARRSVDCPRGKNPHRRDRCNILTAFRDSHASSERFLAIMKNVAYSLFNNRDSDLDNSRSQMTIIVIIMFAAALMSRCNGRC